MAENIKETRDDIELSAPQFESMLETAIDTALIHTWTALPGIIKSYDNAEQTAEIRAAILQEFTDENGNVSNREHPVLLKVPVHFTRGGGFAITHPLNPGDSGLIVFSSRCIDSWAQNGGVQPQAMRRKHSFSDGIFIPGINAVLNALSSVETSGLQIRNDSGAVTLTIDDTGIKFDNGSVSFEADSTDFKVTSTAFNVASADFKNNDVNVGSTHIHIDAEGRATTGPQ